MLHYLKNIFLKPGPRYSWPKVFLTITFSFLVVSALFAGLYFLKKGLNGAYSSSSPIQRIAQTGSKSCPLSTEYLAEVLDLSVDQPKSLLHFKTSEAKKKLYATHLIKKARFKKIKPDILFIDYSLREPIAFLEDFTNMALDQEGFLFPYTPFFSPRALPKIYLGEKSQGLSWGQKLSENEVALIRDFFCYFDPTKIKKLDLSQIHAESYGKRQIVLTLFSDRIIRLTVKNYAHELMRYLILEERVLKKQPGPYVIDLRTENVAYIERRL